MDRLLSSVVKVQRGIIGAALATLLLLSGCSALKLGYGQGPALAWWWLDDQVDFDAAQAPRVKEALARWFDWHRRTQLAPTVALLAQLREEAPHPVTADQVCRITAQVRALLVVAVEQALPPALTIVQDLGPAQLQHIERQGRKRLARQREEQLPTDPQRRHELQLERTVDRAEDFYGRLGPAQRQVLEAGLRRAPMSLAQSFELRERRQAELLQVLGELAHGGAAAATAGPPALERLRAIARRYDGREPLQPELSAAQERHTCALLAELHNSTTAEQRRRLVREIAGWENDLRALQGTERTGSGSPSPARAR